MAECGRVRLSTVIGVAVLAVLAAVALAPSTSRQAIGRHRFTHEVPRYTKVFDFLRRDAHYRRLAHDITRTATSDEERARAVFTWTRENIRRSPPDWVVVDDHILNVITRGHGVDYQRVDVFATLATYAGTPAFWVPHKGLLGFPAFVLINGNWAVFDVLNGIVFTNDRGELSDAREVVPDVKVPPERPLRAERQMPCPRVRCEIREATMALSRAVRPQ